MPTEREGRVSTGPQPWYGSLNWSQASINLLRARAERLEVPQLRPYGYDYAYINLLTVFGETHPPEQIRDWAVECMRNHLWFGEEFHMYSAAAYGQRPWDEEMRNFDAGIRLSAATEIAVRKLLSKTGFIACGFHWGGFRYIPYELASLGIPVKVLVGAEGFGRYFSEFVLDQRQVAERERRGVPGKFCLADTLRCDNSAGMLRTLRSLKKNRGIVYIPVDGMFTAEGAHKPQSGSVADIVFAGIPLRVKASPARLARTLEVPLVTFFAGREGPQKVVIEVSDIVSLPHEAAPSFDAVQVVMQRIYGSLEKYARTRPGLWEGARTFHHWRVPAKSPNSRGITKADLHSVRMGLETGSLRLDDRRLVRVQVPPGTSAWIDARTLRCLRGSQEVQRILEALGNPDDLAQLWQQTGKDEQRGTAMVRFLAQLQAQGLLRANEF